MFRLSGHTRRYAMSKDIYQSIDETEEILCEEYHPHESSIQAAIQEMGKDFVGSAGDLPISHQPPAAAAAGQPSGKKPAGGQIHLLFSG